MNERRRSAPTDDDWDGSVWKRRQDVRLVLVSRRPSGEGWKKIFVFPANPAKAALDRAGKDCDLDIKTLQRLDTFANGMSEVVTGGEVKSEKPIDDATRAELVRVSDRYLVKDGLLLYLGDDRRIKGAGRARHPVLYVPEELRVKLMTRYHSAGHRGYWRLFHTLRDKYYWPGMAVQCMRHAETCETCQRFLLPKAVTRSGQLIARFPNDVLAIDFYGEMPITAKGHRWALLMVDMYDKTLIVIPIKDKKSTTVSQKLEKHWIHHYTCPRRILSDRDRELHRRAQPRDVPLMGNSKDHDHRMESPGKFSRRRPC